MPQDTIRPSEVAGLFRFTTVEGTSDSPIVQMDFVGREYWLPVYDWDLDAHKYSEVVVCAARQSEKSTNLANLQLSGALVPGDRSLYVNSSERQTKDYSAARIDDTVNNTPVLARSRIRGVGAKYGVFEKHFVGGVIVYLSFASVDADRVRGKAVRRLFLDEVQDMAIDILPVIIECTGRVVKGRFVMLAGTHKTFDSTLNQRWEKSTKSEVMIPCHHHSVTVGSQSVPYYQNIGPDNVRPKTTGIVCDKCEKRIDHLDPGRILVPQKPEAPYLGLRIPRPIVPWCTGRFWDEEVLERIYGIDAYPEAQVRNEILAMPFDKGVRPLTHDDVLEHCDVRASTLDHGLERGAGYWGNLGVPCFMGVDHGLGINDSYTFITIAGHYQGKRLNVFYTKRLTGDLADSRNYLKLIVDLVRRYRVVAVGVDFGMGHHINPELIRALGPNRVLQIQYTGSMTAAPIIYDPRLHLVKASKSFALDNIIRVIKKGWYTFPREEECREFVEDCTALFYEERNNQVFYNRREGVPDDGIHALTYMTIASAVLHRPIPEVFTFTVGNTSEIL